MDLNDNLNVESILHRTKVNKVIEKMNFNSQLLHIYIFSLSRKNSISSISFINIAFLMFQSKIHGYCFDLLFVDIYDLL